MIQVLEIRIGTLKVSTLTCLTQATLIKYIFPDVWLQSIIQTDILQRFIFIQPIRYNLVRHNKKWNIFSLNKMDGCWNLQVEVCPILIVIYPPPGWLARSVSEGRGAIGHGAALDASAHGLGRTQRMPAKWAAVPKTTWGTVLSSPRFG